MATFPKKEPKAAKQTKRSTFRNRQVQTAIAKFTGNLILWANKIWTEKLFRSRKHVKTFLFSSLE